MECKYTQTLGSLTANTGINRYIMECKSKFGIFRNINSPRINRYIMECKLFIYIILYSFICELIDTLWNVNRYKGKSSSIVDGINRYIMECKSKTVLRTLRATW